MMVECLEVAVILELPTSVRTVSSETMVVGIMTVMPQSPMSVRIVAGEAPVMVMTSVAKPNLLIALNSCRTKWLAAPTRPQSISQTVAKEAWTLVLWRIVLIPESSLAVLAVASKARNVEMAPEARLELSSVVLDRC